MTKEESLIITAYTGVFACKEFGEFHEFVEKTLQRPVFTHELASKEIWDKLKEVLRDDFLKIVNNISD